MSIGELAEQQDGLCVAGRCIEPTVSVARLLEALQPEDIEPLRPLLPVGYDEVARAYRSAASTLTTDELTNHYTTGMDEFRNEFVPWLRELLANLSGGHWQLEDYVAFAAGSDVDMMTHIVESVASREQVFLFPGDWYGFLVGSTHQTNIAWQREAHDGMACLCIPSVRNGHVADEMIDFLDSAEACLLNLNLYPTLAAEHRHAVSARLQPVLSKSMLSISFSRGFGMTASQLGVMLIHRDHPYRKRFEQQWNWFTYFYNAIATKTLMEIDFSKLREVDERRRDWVRSWLKDRELPEIASGSYYVKSFKPDGSVPDRLKPLMREGTLRLCLKPNVTGNPNVTGS